MCGILGYVYNKSIDIETEKGVLKNMLEALAHRGPDGHDFWISENRKVFFGHRRLSIIDLSDNASQPMGDENNDIIITFNGEIYNFNEIKNELIALNYTFVTTSDTEVIIYAYKQWGLDAISKFIGMFAIAIYDKRTEKVIFVRDRFGVKPLYLYLRDDLMIFASEVKAFHAHSGFVPELNKEVIPVFLKYGYVPAPYCIFNNIQKIRPGHIVIYDVLTSKIVDDYCYWDALEFFNLPKYFSKTEDEILAEIESLFESAFEYRMVSDVPVGVFLSGGIDSSLVTAMLSKKLNYKVKTFTIGFDHPEFNEAEAAKNTAEYLGCDHHEYICTEKEALEFIQKLPYIYDEPFADPSSIPTLLLSQKVRQNVTVALSADGGDEIFAGYKKYFSKNKQYEFIRKTPLVFALPLKLALKGFRKLLLLNNNYDRDAVLEKTIELLSKKGRDHSYLKKIDSRLFSNREIKGVLNFKYNTVLTEFDKESNVNNNNSEIEKMQAKDVVTYMVDDILVKVDKATMAYGLEGREPLLDHRILEYVARIPAHFKFKNNVPKYLLKETIYKILPKKLIDRPKKGFGIPLKKWLLNDLSGLAHDYLSENIVNEGNIFSYPELKKILERFEKNQTEADAEKVWRLVSFQMWYQYWINNNR